MYLTSILAVLASFHSVVTFFRGTCSSESEAQSKDAPRSFQSALRFATCVATPSEPVAFTAKVTTDLAVSFIVLGATPITAAYLAAVAARYYLAQEGQSDFSPATTSAEHAQRVLSALEGPPGSSASKRDEFCSLHARFVARNPLAEPMTLFEHLSIHINGSEPFYPVDLHAFKSDKWQYLAVRRAVALGFQQSTGPFLEKLASSVNNSPYKTLHQSEEAELTLDLADVTRLLLENAARVEYMTEFLPKFMGRRLDVHHGNSWGRRKALAALCPGEGF